MKEIKIRNGNNIDKIEVESREILTAIKDTIKAIFREGRGVLILDSPENTTHYPHLFLANSVIEYPKFD